MESPSSGDKGVLGSTMGQISSMASGLGADVLASSAKDTMKGNNAAQGMYSSLKTFMGDDDSELRTRIKELEEEVKRLKGGGGQDDGMDSLKSEIRMLTSKTEGQRDQITELQIENQKLKNDLMSNMSGADGELMGQLMDENDMLKKRIQEYALMDSTVASPDPREFAVPNKSRATTPGTRASTRGGDGYISKLHARIKDLEGELQLALGLSADIALLKKKLEQLSERNRIEKEKCIKAENDGNFAKKKMEILADHLNKLMTHLKHEAAAKVRTQEKLRSHERDLVSSKEKLLVVQAKSSAKDRLVLELREGAKILEDQLRLMDEKYLELRGKLDWARENSEKKIQQAQRKAKELRKKFALLGHGALDKVQLPGIDPGSVSTFALGESVLEGSGSVASSVDFGSSMGGGTATGKGKRGKKGMNQSQTSQESSGGLSLGQPSLDSVMEKIRRHQGGKREWDDDTLRDLAKSR